MCLSTSFGMAINRRKIKCYNIVIDLWRDRGVSGCSNLPREFYCTRFVWKTIGQGMRKWHASCTNADRTTRLRHSRVIDNNLDIASAPSASTAGVQTYVRIILHYVYIHIHTYTWTSVYKCLMVYKCLRKIRGKMYAAFSRSSRIR